MKKIKMYRYIGHNGIITTPVLLDNIPRIDLFHLIAGAGKILTDGEQLVKEIVIEIDKLNQWGEIEDLGQE